MINLLDILFSTGMVLLIMGRAAWLDRLLPWFAPPPEPDPRSAEHPRAARKWRR